MSKFIFLCDSVISISEIKAVFLEADVADNSGKTVYKVVVVAFVYEEGKRAIFYTDDYEEAVAEQGRIFELLNN